MTACRIGLGGLALLLAACGSFSANDLQGRQADAEIEVAKRRLAEDKAEVNNPGMYRTLIEQMQGQGLYFASLAHIAAYEQRFGVTDEIVLMRADAQRETGQDALAEAGYRTLLRTPVAARAWHGLGLLAGRAGHFGDAVSALRQAERLDPTNAALSSDLGYALMRSGAIEAARVPVLRAGELAPQNRKVLSNIALYLLVSGGGERAEAMMTQMAFPPAVREAVRRDAVTVRRSTQQSQGGAQPAGTRAGLQGWQQGRQQDRLLERFSASP